MAKIVIGIPCYNQVSPETLEDYMRFSLYLGRNTDHEYFCAIKTKSEQFRARNSIVEAALQIGADYLFFLDDDHVLNWENSFETNSRYGLIDKFIDHLKEDINRAIVGALYYHRGGDCRPVLMKEGKDGGYFYLRDDEITGGMQEVAVQGGGCMLIDMNLFSVIPSPWFEPETGLGTDLQICEKAREAGKSVWCDTSIVIGHVKNTREVITPKNRHRVISESGQFGVEKQGMDAHYTAESVYNLYKLDALEYLQMNEQEVQDVVNRYTSQHMEKFKEFEDPKDYYAQMGNEQLIRQVCFHAYPEMIDQAQTIYNFINMNMDAYGVDYGCGSSPVGFEFLMKGHKMDFIDIDGAGAYEFLKWRVKHRNVESRAGFELNGPYDYALFLDSIEHIKNWEEVLTEVCGRLNKDGVIVTNYFLNTDFENVEHISMDHDAVKSYLVSLGVYPVNEMIWMKRDFAKVAS